MAINMNFQASREATSTEGISATEYYFDEVFTPNHEANCLSTMIAEAADGIVVGNTLSQVIEDLVSVSSQNNCERTRKHIALGEQTTQTSTSPEPIIPSRLNELPEDELSKMFSLLPAETKKIVRLVCKLWKNIVENDFLVFRHVLTRDSVSSLETWTWPNMKIEKLTACNLLGLSSDRFKRLNLWKSVKHLEIESQRLEDYENHKQYEQPTIGEKNLVEIFKLCVHLESLVLNSGSVGNFGLELLDINKDENCNEIVVGWQWPKVHESVSAVGEFLHKILGDLNDNFNTGEIIEPYNVAQEDPSKMKIIPSDPPVVEVTYKMNPSPPFPAFLSLACVNLSYLQNLLIVVQPTRNSEKIGLIAFLHVLTFPQLYSFTLNCQEYVPDEALYRSVFRFILKHKNTLKQLTFTNPILSTIYFHTGDEAKQSHLLELEKVRLREMTVAWELPIGLDMFWPNGYYLLESQRRLRKLEFHTTNALKAATIVLNNFRFLTQANIDITDTGDKEFDCKCFEPCARLKSLTLHVAINVKIENVSCLPDTLEFLYWDALYTREHIRWFSRFLILAKAVHLYHDKGVPMDIFAPFNFGDFIHFIRLPCLEQLHLPRIHVQDPRVTRFCSWHHSGIFQDRDFFLIDRKIFLFRDSFAQDSLTGLTE